MIAGDADLGALVVDGARRQWRDQIASRFDDLEFGVNLRFERMADFRPESVVQQVEPLRKLMETRDQLRDLLSKADRSETLETLLEQILSNEEKLKALGGELGVEAATDSKEG